MPAALAFMHGIDPTLSAVLLLGFAAADRARGIFAVTRKFFEHVTASLAFKFHKRHKTTSASNTVNIFKSGLCRNRAVGCGSHNLPQIFDADFVRVNVTPFVRLYLTRNHISHGSISRGYKHT